MYLKEPGGLYVFTFSTFFITKKLLVLILPDTSNLATLKGSKAEEKFGSCPNNNLPSSLNNILTLSPDVFMVLLLFLFTTNFIPVNNLTSFIS